MRFARSILARVALLAYAVAQSAPVAFTSVPAVVVAGSSYNITWGGGDGTPITITLRKGQPSNLTTVAVLADGLTGDSYVWNVSTALPTASDYALQITQGQSDINYSGLFSVAGGTGPSSISYSGMTTSTSASNSSATMTAAGAAGTMSGNSTMLPHNATSSSSNSSTTAHSTSGATVGIGNATASQTSAAPTASQTTAAPSSGVASQLGSSAALVMGLFAAIMCLS